MNHVAVVLWFLNMAVDTGGQLAFKAAATQGLDLSWREHWRHMAGRPWLWIGVTCYVVEFFVWMAFLSQVTLSSGVMLGCINIVAIMLAGRWCFNEKLSFWRVAGITLICLGVALVGVGE